MGQVSCATEKCVELPENERLKEKSWAINPTSSSSRSIGKSGSSSKIPFEELLETMGALILARVADRA